ncbi:MMPL family transporter [Pseudonocardia sp. CA-107938]|uniref:MMPL family transporter n=1 Tax=Pseudonocardia sp. CA-107938 TaxID=3240021 RepID=UPI003D8DF1F2
MAGDRGAVVRVATWSARNPWRAVVGWLVFVAICVAAGSLVGKNKGAVADFRVGEAGRAEAAAEAAGLAPPLVEQILLTAAAGGAPDPAVAADVAARMREVPGVDGVGEPVASGDGTVVRVPVRLSGNPEQAKAVVPRVLAATAVAQAAHPDVRIVQTGSASIAVGVNELQGSDLARTEAISLPVTFLILLVAFGAVLAAGIPVLLALSAVAGAVGLYALASWIFPDAGGAVTSVIFMLGMAVGVDYSLFYLKRVREERARGSDAAVQAAAATAGRAIVTSGLGVAAGLVGLYVVDDVIFSSIATGAVLVVAVAVAGSLTALPALLALLGDRVDPWRRRSSGRFATLLGPATRYPVATLAGTAVLVVALAWPAVGLALGTSGKDTFPRAVPAVAAYGELTAAFPTEGIAHLVVVRAEPDARAAAQAGVDRLGAALRVDPVFAGSQQRLRTSADGSTWTLAISLPERENSAPARASLTHLRTLLIPAAFPDPGVDVLVSGEVARGVDYAAHQAERLAWVIGCIALATFAVLAVALGSPVLAGLGVLLNVAAVAVSWGVLVLVFQGHWAEGLLGFTSIGVVEARVPLMICAILVGLSTDYQIFVVSRIREAVADGVPTRIAVREGIERSAGVVTSAAVIMISVFVSFMFMTQVELKQVGLGLAVAVAFDAVVLRVLLLPAAMTLLDERCWWPRPPRVDSTDRALSHA